VWPGDTHQALKILLAVESAAAGVGLHTIDLAVSLQKTGHDVFVLYSSIRADTAFLTGIEELKKSGAGLHVLDMKRETGTHDLRDALTFRKILKTHGPFDIVHLQSSKAGAIGRLGSIGMKHRTLYTPHMFRTMGPGLSKRGYAVFGGIEKFLDRFSSKTICVSKAEKEHALSLGIPDHKLAVVYNGIRIRAFGDRAELRRQLNVTNETVVLGTICRLAPQKAPIHLVQSFLAVDSSIPHHLVIVGDGELMEETKQAAQGDPRITFLGHADGWSWLAAMDGFVLASHSEGFAYTPIEASANGLAIIVTDTGGNAELITDQVNGLVVPVADQPKLSQAMKQLIEDQELRKKLGDAALVRAQEFTVETMADRIAQIYEELAPARR
jgi:glycosyltransferase involved in cell wall biosynthesis